MLRLLIKVSRSLSPGVVKRGFYTTCFKPVPLRAKIPDEKAIKCVSVYRYDPESGEKPYMQEYEVDLRESGLLVLDVLNYIKNEIDPTLTYRRSCREGICGSCGMNIAGKNYLACIHTCPDTAEFKIYPLPHMYVIKDLVVDMNNFYAQYRAVEPWLQRCGIDKVDYDKVKQLKQSIRDRDKMDMMYECILCACCSTSCPAYWWHGTEHKGFAGPAALLHAYRWIIDSRDDMFMKRVEMVSKNFNPWKCHTIFNCAVACPKGLNPGKLISHLKLMSIGRMQKEEPDMSPDEPDQPDKSKPEVKAKEAPKKAEAAPKKAEAAPKKAEAPPKTPEAKKEECDDEKPKGK